VIDALDSAKFLSDAAASAKIYSLLITAKANCVEPVSCLTRFIEQLPNCKTMEDY
jgi:hypothetical protein